MEGEPCELCGEEVSQLQNDEEGNPAGPWYERRTHRGGGALHTWHQLHNCVKPQPDDCRFCRANPDPQETR